MAKKRPVPYSRKKAVKSLARERVGVPPPSRSIEEKPLRDKPKYKKPLDETAE